MPRQTRPAIRRCVLALACGLGFAAAPAAARACAGDCDRNGAVTVAELVRGVRIALGGDAVSRCPAFDSDGDGVVRIAELIGAVGGALAGGCPVPATATPADLTPSAAVPTATPTATATATDTPMPSPTPTASPTATAALPDIAGTWREDTLTVVASSCFALLTQQFANELAARPPCVHQVTQSGNRAGVVDCNGKRSEGDVDTRGTLRLVLPAESGAVEGCTVVLDSRASIDAGVSPTTAIYTFDIGFSGACPVPDCTIVAQGIWTRVAAGGGGTPT